MTAHPAAAEPGMLAGIVPDPPVLAPVATPPCPPVAELTAFQAGRLPDDRLAALGDHVDGCPTCRAVLDATPADGLLAAVRETADADPAATRLADFRIVREIGRGGMGVVYEAVQTVLGRPVALKVMSRRLAPDAAAVRRFDREARAVARLHHTHIVPVFAVGRDDGVPFYAMQLIAGTGLEKVIEARRPPVPPAPAGRADWAAVAEIGRQAAAALAHAHARGVVHRDVKPSNLLLDAAGQVWLTDFGLAKTADAGDDLTGTGDLLGTPRYMPPEAFDRPADARGDVYALGLTVYELIAGRPAFDADRGQVVKLVLTTAPPPPRVHRPDVPADLETVVLKAIDRDPDRRYQTAADLAEDFRRVAADESVLARRAGPAERLARWARHHRGLAAALAVLAAVLVAAAAGGLIAADRFRRQADRETGLRQEQEALVRKETAAREAAEAAGAEVRRELAHAELSAAVRTAYAPDGPDRVAAVVARWRPPPGGWEWRLADRMARPAVRAVPVGRSVDHVDWSPDGRRLLAGGVGRVSALDAADGRVVWEWESPDRAIVTAVRWSPDGKTAAVGVVRAVYVLDAGTGAVRFDLPAADEPVLVAWHPDGEHLAFRSGPRAIRVVHWPTGRAAAELGDIESMDATVFAFRPDGRRFAALVRLRDITDTQYHVRVWDAADWRPVRTFAPSLYRYTAVAWAAGGDRLVAGTAVGELRLLDPETGTVVRAAEPTGMTATSLAVAPDGRRVVATGGPGGLREWNPFAPHPPVPRPGGRDLTSAAWSPDGRWVAGGGGGGRAAVPVWDAAAVPADRTFWLGGRRANSSYLSATWDRAGRRLAVCVANTGTQVFDAATGERLGLVRGVEFGWNRDARLTAAVFRETVSVRDGAGRELLAEAELLGQPKRVAWSPAADRLAVRTAGRVWVWDAPGGRPEQVFGEPPAEIDFLAGGGLAWNPAGDRLAFAAAAKSGWRMHVFDPAAKRTVRDWPVPLPHAVGWSPDGLLLAAAGEDGVVRLYDPATGELRGELTGHAGVVHAVAWHPAGDRLATAGGDGTVKVWNPAAGKPVVTFEMGEAVRSVAWTADGAGLAAVSESGVARVWHAGSN